MDASTLRDTPSQTPLPPILGAQGASALQHSLDLGWGDAPGVTLNPQGGVGYSCQLPFPITNPQLGGSWGRGDLRL